MLIVDDETNQRRSLALGLRLDSFGVHEAADGEEALAFFESGGEVDVAIIDLMMPGISGLELAQRLRVVAPQVRVVLTSAYHLSERQLARAELDAVAFMPKPYRLDAMVTLLQDSVMAEAG